MSCGGGGEIVTYQWVDCDRRTVSERYDRIARLIPFFDRLFFLPGDLRRKAAMRLGLSRGDSVLDIGCGTGVNFPYLREAVGSSGRIYGVDISTGMLRKATASPNGSAAAVKNPEVGAGAGAKAQIPPARS